ILDGQRLIEPVLRAAPRQILRARADTRQDHCRIARNEVQQRKRDDRNAEQHRYEVRDPAQRVTQHRSAHPATASAASAGMAAPAGALYVSPLRMTKSTRDIEVMSRIGSPSTAMMSASLPALRLPVTWS